MYAYKTCSWLGYIVVTGLYSLQSASTLKLHDSPLNFEKLSIR